VRHLSAAATRSSTNAVQRTAVQVPDVRTGTHPVRCVATGRLQGALAVPLLGSGDRRPARAPPALPAVPPDTVSLLEIRLAILPRHLNARLFRRSSEEPPARGREPAQSQFLANMSHELRTPLNASCLRQLMQDGLYGDLPPRPRTCSKGCRERQAPAGIISGVLDLAKIEAGQLVLSIDEYSMKDVPHGGIGDRVARRAKRLKVDVSDMPLGR
jgi:signal transduction histidine kinase